MQTYKAGALLLLVTMLFYGASLTYGFSQDDFFHLIIAKADNLKEFGNFFLPHPESWVFYRPLSTQFWYWLFESLFGWQNAPIPMHMAALLIHTANAYLVTLMLEKVFKLTSRAAVLGGAVYAASSIHFLSLFYIGATQQLLTTFFGLLAAYANLKNQKVREVTFFLLSLLSKEIALRLVPVVILMRIIRGENWVTAVKKSAALIGVAALYLGVRYAVGVSAPPEYAFDFGVLTTAATGMWYGLMTLGAPEHLLTYGLSAGRIDILGFLRDFPIAGTLNVGAVVLLLVACLAAKPSRSHVRYIALWGAALIPVFFLPSHRYAHYLDLSLLPVLAWLLARTNPRWLKMTAGTLLFIAFTTGQSIDRRTHWTVERAELARSYREKIEAADACHGDALVFAGEEIRVRDLSYALMYENGPRIICNREELQVYYSSTMEHYPEESKVIEVE